VLLAGGYSGPPSPTGVAAFTSWTLDPVILAFVVLAGVGYALGLSAARRRGINWPARRPIAYFAGLATSAIATMSALGSYAHAMFSVYMVQILLLLTIAPLLLAIGRPVGLAVATLPAPVSDRLSAVLRSRPARLVTSPIISPLFLAAVPFGLYFTHWYQGTLDSYPQYELLHVVLLGIGFVVQYPLWETGESGYGFPYPLLLFFAFIELLVDAVPGIVLRLETHLMAPGYYLALARPWGPSPLTDQHIGADILWCVAEAIDLPFLILFLVQWIRADSAEAARVDQELDTVSASRTVAAAAGSAPAVDSERPWWENDASVFGDRANQFRGGR
jgi:putative membrane protein